MVTQQILSKVINEKNLAIIDNNGLGVEYFPEYEEEYNFIKDHLAAHGNIPDEATFLSKFPNFTLLDVQESEQYLVHTVEEERLYALTVPVLERCANLLQTDSRDAVEFFRAKLPELQPRSFTSGTDIVSQADIRYEEWEKRTQPGDDTFISSSFEALDAVTGGWRRGEELVVLFARTGQGKTFVLMEILRSAWEQGITVGLVEPEMSPSSVGYRFDTLQSHISNKALYRGYGDAAYAGYIDDLKKKETPFWVATPRDFGKKVTVQKLKSWCIHNKIGILAVDGVGYLVDERAERNDSRTVQLTNISEDFMYDLSQELGIPVIIVCQANRNGVHTEVPGLESIRDSDGISHNASIVISIRKTRIEEDSVLVMSVEKTRNGPSSEQINYNWDVDHGTFVLRLGEGEETPAPPPRREPRVSAAPARRPEEQF